MAIITDPIGQGGGNSAPAKKKKKTVKAAKKKGPPNKPFNGSKLVKAMIDARFERGESILTAAVKSKMGKSTWQQIETSGQCKPQNLGLVCNYIGVPVQTFF